MKKIIIILLLFIGCKAKEKYIYLQPCIIDTVYVTVKVHDTIYKKAKKIGIGGSKITRSKHYSVPVGPDYSGGTMTFDPGDFEKFYNQDSSEMWIQIPKDSLFNYDSILKEKYRKISRTPPNQDSTLNYY